MENKRKDITNMKQEVNLSPDNKNDHNQYKSIDRNYNINTTSITSSEIDSLIIPSDKKDYDPKEFLKEKENSVIKIYFTELIILIPAFIGITCYLLSLEPCLKDYDTCLNELDKAKVARLLTISCISFISLSFKYFICFHFQIKFKFFRLTFLTLILAYLTLFYDTGNSFSSHGAYNRLFIFLGIPIAYLGFYSMLLMYRLSHRYGKLFLIAPLTLLILTIIYSHTKYYNSCVYWDKGFKHSKIDNKVSCQLKKPSICNEIIFDNLFDVVSYLKDDCKKRRNDDINIVKEYINLNNFTRLAYPRVENWEHTVVCNYYEYRNSVLKYVFDLDDPYVPSHKKAENEVYVEFSKDKSPEVKINLKKDEKLIKERNATFTENFQKGLVPAKNILFFFIDSMSRNHFKRKLNRLYKWIEKYYESDSSVPLEAFQLLKYHGVGTWTNINLQPFFFGVPYDASEGAYALTFFKDRGYITGSTENTCSREFVGLYSGEMSGLDWDYYDHDFTSFFCDPNFYAKEKVYSMIDGPYCYRKKCLYGKQTYEYSVDYSLQFFEAYKNYGKMFRIGNIDAHEGTGESIKYVEDDMLKFLDSFEKNGHLNDSIIIFFSDHGYTMPGIHQILQSEDHVKELLLPFIYFLIPKNVKNFNKIKENLKHNEQMFVTPYDIHNTLLGMLNVDRRNYNNKGVDIFNNKLKGNEGCKKFKIKPEWCKCHHDDKSLN